MVEHRRNRVVGARNRAVNALVREQDGALDPGFFTQGQKRFFQRSMIFKRGEAIERSNLDWDSVFGHTRDA